MRKLAKSIFQSSITINPMLIDFSEFFLSSFSIDAGSYVATPSTSVFRGPIQRRSRRPSSQVFTNTTTQNKVFISKKSFFKVSNSTGIFRFLTKLGSF